MSSCFKPIAEILEATIGIGKFLIGSELYYAHTSPSKKNDPEILSDHIELVQKKLAVLTNEHNLDYVIDSLINEILIENKIDETQICGDYLKKIFVNTIVFHDYGKINENFQAHPNKMNNPNFWGKEKKGSPLSTHHSALGAYLFITKHFDEINTTFQSKEQPVLYAGVLTLSYAIFKHHGKWLDNDFKKIVNFNSEQVLMMSQYLLNYQYNLEERFSKLIPLNIGKLFQQLEKSINSFALYALFRLNFSLLTASDYLASGEYMTGMDIKNFGTFKIERINQLYDFVTNSKWINQKEEKLNYNADTYKKLQGYSFKNPKEPSNLNLNILRQEMAIEVIQNIRANINKNLFYIEAPTGGGKTNLSMLATVELLKAEEGKITKVFYVFPFTTLITQTYKTIIETLNLDEKEVVQLHSKAGYKINKNEEVVDGYFSNEKKNYIDNLFVHYPICLLSHINFFDLLKTNEKESNYLLHRLANSVVVIDELQSYNPAHWDKIIYFIHHYAAHFNIKFVLMSATLPKIGSIEITKNKVSDFVSLLPNAKTQYFNNPNFKERVTFNFDMFDKKVELSELASLLLTKSKEHAAKDFGIAKPKGSIYVIIEFIFKRSAIDFYKIISVLNQDFFDEIFVLSGTILEHRRRYIINYLKNKTNRQKRILLVTTQVVEAGVDIDMDLGFKDSSLIDSDEQLAGRINRNVNKEGCILYLFNFNNEKIIYGSDKRYEEMKGVTQQEYERILNEKDFDALYNKVFDKIYKWNNTLMAIGLEEYKQKIQNLQFRAVHEDFKLIDQDTISCFIPLHVPIYVAGQIAGSQDDIFSIEELQFLSNHAVYPTLNNGLPAIKGEQVFNIYLDLIRNKKEFVTQKISEKTLQGIMSKFICSLFASPHVKNQITLFSDEEKSEYGYQYISGWKDFFDVDFGLDHVKFNSNETQFL